MLETTDQVKKKTLYCMVKGDKAVVNIVGNGENGGFQNLSPSLRVINSLPHNHDFQHSPYKKPFENIVRKGENAGNKHFLLFSQCFLPSPKQISIFEAH